MGGYDLVELTKPFEADQDHESFVKFRMEGSRSVTRRFVERDVQTEQRREQVVLELRRLFAHRTRFRRHQVEERLLRIQPGRNEAARMNLLPGCQFNARCATVVNEDAAQLDA